jgi:hypothetical protein
MKFLREPLVHFLLIGAVLFGLFAIFGRAAGEAPPGTIVLTPGLIENLKVSFVRTNGQPPTPAQLDAAIADYVREEIFTREAYAKGLDKDDPVVRRELRTRMENFYEDNAETPTPTEADLRTYLQQHPNDFKGPDGQIPDFDKIRQQVQDAWASAQRKAALDAAYEKLRARYTVKMPDVASSAAAMATTAPPTSTDKK